MVTDRYRGVSMGYTVVNNFNMKLVTCASVTQQVGRRQPHIAIEIRSNMVFRIGMQSFLESFTE